MIPNALNYGKRFKDKILAAAKEVVENSSLKMGSRNMLAVKDNALVVRMLATEK